MTTAYEDGSPSAKLIVLGQAPGRTEIRYKKPLVGPSGDVFRDCIHNAKIARGELYILNVWEDEVFTDAKGSIFTKHGGGCVWTKKGFTEYGLELAEPTLQRIRRSGANCILALGQQALELCSGKAEGIMKWRGSILRGLERVGSKKVVGTVHPAATLHGVYLWRYLIISDAKRAREESERNELILPVRDILIEPDFKQVMRWIKRCRDEKLVATDLEVVNHQISCFSLSPNPHEAIVVPLTCEYGDYWDEEHECDIWKAYADLMHDPAVQKVNQNLLGFDAPFLMKQMRIHTRGCMDDPMIAQSVLYPEFNKGLDFIASVHTREPYWKDEGKMWKNEGGDFPTFWRYNGKDSCVALEAWYVLEQELRQRDMRTTYQMTVDMAQPLLFMSMYGLQVDREKLEQTKSDIQKEIEAQEAALETAADFPFNPGSSTQCAKYFYDHKGIKPYKNAQGGITCDDKAMSRIYRKTNLPEAKLVQEIRGLRKLKTSYLEVETDEDDRIRCSWNLRGTWTGRLSSSKTIFGTGMNLQNLSPRFKDFIVEDGG